MSDSGAQLRWSVGARHVWHTNIPKISVLNSILVYLYDCFSYTDMPKSTIYRNVLVYRNLQYGKSAILLYYNTKTGFLLRLPVGRGGVINSPRSDFLFFSLSQDGLPLMGDTAVQYTDCYLSPCQHDF